jgi:hypothetical protein
MSRNDTRDYHGSHVVWCGCRNDIDFHADATPYCEKPIHGVPLVPEGGAIKSTIWTSATKAFVHGLFSPAQHDAMEARYNGVELAVETWLGAEQGHQDPLIFRLTSGAARSLAATLIRAADIEPGLYL